MASKEAARAEGARIFAAFQAAGAQPVEADILQPAEVLLDLYGEDIRARAYTSYDPLRGEMMLRPDFTVPVVQMHMTDGAEPARYCYMGEVFRKQDQRGLRKNEFLQAGYEVFARDNPADADAEVFALFDRVLAPLGLRAATGDIGILMAAVRGLSTTEARKQALLRHIWRPKRFKALLERFAAPSISTACTAALTKALSAVPDAAQIGLRGPDEVAERLRALADDATAPPIPRAEVALLDDLLDLHLPSPAALDHLREVARDFAPISDAVEGFAKRLAALSARGVDVAALDFEASHGRTTLEYYDGFVFSFHSDRADLPPIASGGRYDALTRVLGQGRSIPAVGGIIRPGLVADLGGLGPC